MPETFWRQDYHITYFPQALDPDAAQAVAASPGKTVRVDIQIARSAGVKVSGRVIPPSSWACPANASCYTQVGLTPRPATALNVHGWLRSNAAQPDNGFEIAGVLPGAYTLAAVTQVSRMDEPGGGKLMMIHGLFRRIEVGAGGLGPIDLELKPLNEIAGSITFADGCPHTGLRIIVSEEPGVLSRSMDVQVPAGETTFTLAGMGPGRVTLGLMPLEIGANLPRVESIRLGDQEVSKSGFDYPTGGTQALQIRVGCSSQGGTAQ
ncbi:MAG: hypothetical protein ABSC08_03295 [Bryobacteraceae bacterium]|jgi:hypothetical protein